MKVFVTGSTGLFGSNLVRLLCEQGYSVKALARSKEKADKFIRETGAEVVLGDLSNIDAFADQMDGCDVLIHAAAYFREYYQPGDHWGMLQKLNVDATIELLKQAENRGYQKAIHISSSGVIGRNADGSPSTEESALNHLAETNLYFKSKVLAEEEIAKFLETSSLPVTLILPGWMHGPGDSAPTSAGQLAIDFVKGDLPGRFDGGMTMVDARDVAQATINAIKRGKSGERYIVAGTYHTMDELTNMLEQASGVPAPKAKIPFPVLMTVAFFSETWARLTNGHTLITRTGIRTLHDKIAISSEKAEQELSVEFRSMQETLNDVVNWYRANGYV